ncbi:MAG: hypothetical protein ACLFNX_00985 [Spirochaetaceae bacterium]
MTHSAVRRRLGFVPATVMLLGTLLWNAPVFAQPDYGMSDATEEAVSAITGVAEMIIADSFSPMTGFDEGELRFVVSPALFQIDQVHEDPEVGSDNLGGWSVGAGVASARSDRLLLYGIASAMRITGAVELEPYDGVDQRVGADIDYSLASLLGGVGYELYESRMLSIPAFIGPQLLYYSGNVEPETVESGGYTVESSLSGTGLIPAVSGGIAAALEILGTVKITPYVLGLVGLSGTALDAQITATRPNPPNLDTEEDVSVDPTVAAMFGLDMGYHSAAGWSVSLALGDLIAYFTGAGNTVANDGLEMRPLILIVAYSN